MASRTQGSASSPFRKATCSSWSTPQAQKSYGYDGSVRWALNAEEVLPARTRRASLAEWEPKVPVDAWNRAASLLGLTADAEDCA
jgi:hypothetical protein